jgi:ribosomal protein L18E
MANYKKASVVVIAAATGAQTITNNASAATLQFTETTDSAGVFDGETFTTPYTGFYQFNFSLGWGAGITQSSGFVALQKVSPFTTVAYRLHGAAGSGAIQNVSRVVRLIKGDEIRLLCSQVTGADRIPDADDTTLSIVRVANAS